MGAMSGLFVSDEQVAHARRLAREITNPIFQHIERHTTVAVERTVLRWFGVDGVGAEGAPLVNLMIDRLQAAGVLDRGAAYWYGRALRMGASSPLDAVERLASAPLEALGPLSPAEEASLRDEVRAEARAAMEEFRGRVARREALKAQHPMGQAPHKYVIVATGNIFDDVDQARAAAQAGRRHHRRHPLHRAVAAGLRAAGRHHRGLRRHLRHAGELPRHARGPRRRVEEAGPLHRADQLLLGPVHAGDRLHGGLGAAGHAAQRRDVRHPLPRHQPAAHLHRSVLLAPHLRLGRHHHQHRRGQLHHHRRRLRRRAHRHRQPVHQRGLRPPRGPPGRAAGHRAQLRDRPRTAKRRCCSSCRRPCWCAAASPTRRSSTCRPPSTRRPTSSSATPTT